VPFPLRESPVDRLAEVQDAAGAAAVYQPRVPRPPLNGPSISAVIHPP